MVYSASASLSVKDGGGSAVNLLVHDNGTQKAYGMSLHDAAGLIFDLSPALVTGGTTTRPNDTTAYAAADLLANSTTAGSVVPASASVAKATDQSFTILRCRLKKSGTVITNAIFKVHCYRSSPTVTNGDNAAWLSTESGYMGCFDVTIDKAFSDASEGVGYPDKGTAIIGIPTSGAATIYYLIEVRAAYTPIANEVFTPYFEVA